MTMGLINDTYLESNQEERRKSTMCFLEYGKQVSLKAMQNDVKLSIAAD